MNNESQVVDAFSTDGLLKKFDLTLLEDDKNFFPPYYAIPLVNAATMEKYPEILPIINKIAAALNNETMSELNYKVDELRQDPKAVANEFLNDKGII